MRICSIKSTILTIICANFCLNMAAYGEPKNTEEAPTTASPSEESVDKASGLIQKARQARATGELQQAIDFLLEAHALNPNPVLLNNVGKVYEELGRYDLAYATYKKVIDNPKTPSELRTLDKERMDQIAGKLSSALVYVDPKSSWSQVWIDTKGYPMGSGLELPAPVGPLMVDIYDAKSTVVIRLNVDGAAGKRLSLTNELTEGLDKRFGVMSWDRANRKLKNITIDDVPILASLKKAKGVQIAPGRYRVLLEWVGEKETLVNVDVVAGMLIELKPPVKLEPPKVVSAATPPKPVTVEAPPTEKPPEAGPSAKTRWGLISVQAVSMALSLGVGAYGFSEYAAGSSGRDSVEAEQEGIDVNNPSSLEMLRDWESRNDKFTDQTNRSFLFMAAGGIGAFGTLLWILNSDYDQTTTVQIEPNGVVIGGRF